MQYRLLGPLECVRDGDVVDLGVYKQRAVLALLLINANQVVSTDRIIDELWAEDASKDRQNSLWVTISRLRAALEPDRAKRAETTVLVTRTPGYLLAVDAADIDATRFEQLVLEGRGLLGIDPAAASVTLNKALTMWRGRALEEFTYEPFAQAEIARLEELRLSAVEDRISADLAAGRARALVSELEGLVREHPFRERLTAHLMLALHRSGRQRDALRAFGAFQTRLGEELGLEPSADLATLEERIVLDDAALRLEHRQPDAQESGLSVRGYELRSKLNSSLEGDLYRAYQPSVGREVAIQIVRGDLANDADFIRRFDANAHKIARLDHPGMAPVFDYWREPDAAYLVTRYSPLGTLRMQLDHGPLPTTTAIRIVRQVADALEMAHRKGIAHGHVETGNILIDEDHNAYLTNFDIAVQADPTEDVVALATLAEVVLRDATGDNDEQDAPLVGPASGVLTTSYPNIESFLRALDAALDTPESEPGAYEEAENPYQGLRAFDEADAAHFYGRERLVERLIARLGHGGPQGKMVVVVGPSGAGKSSVVRAGVIPALRSGALPDSDHWFIATMTPGRHPFEALEDALRRVAVDPPANLLDRLTSDGIGPAVSSLLADASSQLLIIVDQLEELFSHALPVDSEAFLSALSDVAGDRHSRVKVVATLRADFYDRPLRHPQFGELLRLGTEVITPMTGEQLERAISAPAADVGVAFEPGLVAQIVSDMAGQSSALPLMQYALTELFEQRAGTTITADSYVALGGVSAALVRRADSIFNGLSADARAATREVFVRLVTVGQGSEDTRRRALQQELLAAGDESTAEVLDTFGRHRLLSFDRDPTTRGPTVEIAHEALLSEWRTLDHWIDDARSDILAQRRLATSAAEWQERERDPDFLLTGARFHRYNGWTDDAPVGLTADERAFLTASEHAVGEELLSDRRTVRRLRRLVAGVGAALVLALVAGGVAFNQRNQANDAADRAEAALELEAVAVEQAELATLISRAAAARSEDPQLSLLLALEANRRAPGPHTEQAVLNALGGASIANRIASRPALDDQCISSSIFPDQMDGTLELATVGGRLLRRDPLTGIVTDSGAPPQACAVGDLNTTNSVIVSTQANRAWFGPNAETDLRFDEFTLPMWNSPTFFPALTYQDDDETETITFIHLPSGEPYGTPLVGGVFLAIDANEDESLFALSFARPLAPEGDGRIFIVDTATGEPIVQFDSPDAAEALAFDNATGYLIAGYFGGRILTMDPTTGEVITDITANNPSGYLDIDARADGKIVTVSRGNIEVLDRSTGLVETTVELRNAAEAFVRPDGTVLVVTTDHQVEVYDVDGSGLVETTIPVDPTGHVAFNDGLAAVLNLAAQAADIIDLSTGDQTTLTFDETTTGLTEVLVVYPEADGAWVVSADYSISRIMNGKVTSTTPIGSTDTVTPAFEGRTLRATRFGDMYASIGVRPDGSNEASLIQLGDEARVVLTVDVLDPTLVHPTPDGGLYVASVDGIVRIFDAAGELLGGVFANAFSVDRNMTVDPTTGKIAVASLNQGVFIIDPATLDVELLPGVDRVASLGFGRGGEYLAITRLDGTVSLWDVSRSTSAGLAWDGSGAIESEPAWYDEQSDAIWTSSSGRLLKIPLDPQQWIDRACEIVGRDLTADEWTRYVPGDEEIHSACGEG